MLFEELGWRTFLTLAKKSVVVLTPLDDVSYVVYSRLSTLCVCVRMFLVKLGPLARFSLISFKFSSVSTTNKGKED